MSRSPSPASPTDSRTASTSTPVPTGRPQTTSSRTRTPSTWLSGRWNTSVVPPARPRPTGPGRCIDPDDGVAPASRRANVDLPAPLGPVTATNRCARDVGAQPDERVGARARIAETDVDERDGYGPGLFVRGMRVLVVELQSRRRLGEAADDLAGQREGDERCQREADQLRGGDEQPPVREPEADHAVTGPRDAREPDPHQQVVDRVPEVAQLVERQAPQVGEEREQTDGDRGDRRPQHDHRRQRGAGRAPPAPDPDRDHRADRGAREQAGDDAGATHEEPERRGRADPDDQHPAPLADAEHHERHARGGEQGAPERQQPPEHHETEGEVGQNRGLGQLDGGDRASPAGGRVERWLLTGPLRFGNSFRAGADRR